MQRVEGRTPINLTADSPDNDSEPAFSPDGSQIAFRSERDGGGLFVMGATGESPRRLTDMGHNTTIAAPAAYGFHRVEVRLAGADRPVDGSVFVVRHAD